MLLYGKDVADYDFAIFQIIHRNCKNDDFAQGMSGKPKASTGNDSKKSNGKNKINGKKSSPSGAFRAKKNSEKEPLISDNDHRGNKPDQRVAFSNGNNSVSNRKKLLLVSNRCKYGALLEKAVKPNITAILYNYETNTFDSLLALVSASLGSDEKVSAVGCICSCKHAGLFMLNAQDDHAVLGANSTVIKTAGIGLFFRLLFNNFVDKTQESRLDFFGGAVVNQLDKHFNTLIEITGAKLITYSKEQLGTGRTYSNLRGNFANSPSLGDIYFTADKIRNWTNGTYQTLDLFEKIRTVGKGAFGTAVLYRKKDDDSLVILKEINMSELNSQERQLAMNETKVLKMLNHPNIICCYDSFEENGVLMIEMEYADDGTLAQFLAKQDSPLSETVILSMFGQITCGIRYMHEQKVLHRDLKTANIFMMKEGLLKIGDFGVSKIMNSHMKGANTVLGTPYYISPEICEGKPYDEKSDIWALGCILHEMATQQKTFESTNLPALVNKIMRGNIAPIQGSYSAEFKQLVHDMLHREPSERPTAQMLDLLRIPDLLDRFAGSEDSFHYGKISVKNNRNVSSATRHETRSVLYLYDTSTLNISPVDGFPLKIKIRQIVIGENHFIALGTELNVYAWGENDHGQLGHGNMEPCNKPKLVEALKGKSVTSACAGSSFSVFVSDNGILMTCGDGRYGCLGHGDLVSSQRPRLIESLLSVDVSVVACGAKHVVAVSKESKVFAWGDGKDGCLGLGNTEIKELPTPVNIGDGITIRDVQCGVDGTMLITDVGTLLAFGNNKNNKLGLNERRGFLSVLGNRLRLEVECKKTPTPVRSVKSVVSVAMAKSHTAVLTENGDLYMLGNNKYGQLGTGDSKSNGAPYLVKSLNNSDINTVICGDTYTVAGCADGSLMFWGTRYISPLLVGESTSLASVGEVLGDGESGTDQNMNNNNLLVQPTHRRSHSSTSTVSCRSTVSLSQDIAGISEENSRTPSIQDISSGNSERLQNSRTTSEIEQEESGMSASNTASSANDLRVPEAVYSPTAILRIHGPSSHTPTETAASTPDSTAHFVDLNTSRSDASSSTSSDMPSSDFAVFLDALIPCAGNFYILVSTNAPASSLKATDGPSHRMSAEKHLTTQISCLNLMVPRHTVKKSAPGLDAMDELATSDLSDLDSFGTAPTWIREELKKSLDAVAIESVEVKNVSKQKIMEKSKRMPGNGIVSKKSNPTTTRSNSRVSSSHSSTGSVIHQSSLDIPEKGHRKSRSPSPYSGRTGQANIGRNRVGRGRGRFHYWDSPRPSRSPARRIDNISSLREEITRLRGEKKHTENKLKEVEEKYENILRDLQVKHEKEKLEQERWLDDQIAMLKKQLDEQQREINEREFKRGGYNRSSNRYSSKSAENVKTNSKICSLQ